MRLRCVASVLTSLGLLAVALPSAAQTDAVSAPGAPSAPYCPLQAALPKPAQQHVPAPGQDDGCLVSAAALGQPDALYDVRSRADYVAFHLPGAANVPVEQLLVRPGLSAQRFVVYDGGHLRANALALCAQLRRGGIAHPHVLDGGVAAWARVRGDGQALALSRLGDAEVAGALADAGNRIVVLSPALQPVAKSLHASAPRAATGVLVLADAQTTDSAIQAALAKAGSKPALHWVGSPEALRTLVATQLAMDRKRQAGAAQAALCSAL